MLTGTDTSEAGGGDENARRDVRQHLEGAGCRWHEAGHHGLELQGSGLRREPGAPFDADDDGAGARRSAEQRRPRRETLLDVEVAAVGEPAQLPTTLDVVLPRG